ncbi:MAG: hypothetical protein ACREAX_04495 [Candidatus Nitrosotenuis sp.]
MQTHLDSLLTKKYLIAALVASASVNLLSNLFGKDVAILVGNSSYIPIAGSMMVLSILIIKRYGISGQHGLAWFSFGGYAVSSFIGEMTWLVQELYLKIDTFPSTPDIFYLVSYPFLLMFFIAYFQPVRSAITKKMIIGPIIFSAGILAVGLYFTIGTGSVLAPFEAALATIYPIFDAIIIVPALVGVALFFKGKVNLMWTLFCFGIVLLFAADTAFLFAQSEDSYYTGNPMELLYSWNYILLSFGIYSHLAIFEKPKANRFEDLR